MQSKCTHYWRTSETKNTNSSWTNGKRHRCMTKDCGFLKVIPNKTLWNSTNVFSKSNSKSLILYCKEFCVYILWISHLAHRQKASSLWPDVFWSFLPARKNMLRQLTECLNNWNYTRGAPAPKQNSLKYIVLAKKKKNGNHFRHFLQLLGLMLFRTRWWSTGENSHKCTRTRRTGGEVLVFFH